MRLAELRQPPRQAVQEVHSDGFRLGLRTVYAPWLSGFFRENDGAWHPQARMWVFPRSAIHGKFAQRLANEAPSGVLFDVRRTVGMITEAVAQPEPELFAEGLDVQVFPVHGGNCILQFKRDALLDQVLQRLSGKILQGHSGWLVSLSVEDTIEALATQAGVPRDFIYVHDTETVLHDTADGGDDRPSLDVGGAIMERRGHALDEAERLAAVLSVVTSPLARLDVPPTVLTRAAEHYHLYDYQVAGVEHFLRSTSALNADDMGLGKSRQAATAADLIPGPGAVLVICPSALKINWEREIHLIAPAATVAFAGESKDWTSAGWIVVNYERLGTVVQAVGEHQVTFRVMLCDEAHYLKEPASGRTRNAFLLAKHIPRRYLLTATPVLNREVELHTLLRLSGHPIGDLPANEFVKQFAGKPEMRLALKERLAEWMIRRPKAVVKGLKGKSLQLQYVQLSDEGTRAYRRLAANPDIPGLVKVGELRQLLEQLKITWLIETIGAMAPEDKVLVFSEHLDIVPLLSEALAMAGIGCVTYTGTMSPKKRQASVDRFQADPAVRVFIGLRKAAGVGLTLTAANYVIPVSLPWNGALRRQAEDRAYRNGQTRHVTVLIPIVPGTIDEKVLALNRHKEAIEGDLLDGGDRPPDPLSLLGEATPASGAALQGGEGESGSGAEAAM